MSERMIGARIAVVLILHGLLWACAMLFSDAIWGDRVSQALVWPALIASFVLLFGLALGAIRKSKKDF